MAVFKKGNYWYIDYYEKGKRKRENAGISRQVAELLLKKRKTEAAERKFFGISKADKKTETKIKEIYIEEIAEDFLKYSINNKRTADKDKVMVEHLLDFFGKKKADDITPAMIEEYKSRRIKYGLKPASVNREIACLKCMFNHAIRNRKVNDNPMKYVRLFKENNTIVRFLDDDELGRLLNACSLHLRQVVLTALLTGMRKGEILDLKWSDVNFLNNVILLKKTKSGKWREIPVSSGLLKVLEICRSYSNGKDVFCNEHSEPYKRHKMDSEFARTRKKAEVNNFRFHDLRHSAASYMVMSGIDLITVMEILGHAKIDTTLRYAHLSPSHKRHAVEALASKMDTYMDTNQIRGVQKIPDLSSTRRGTQVAEGAGLLNL